MFKAGDTIIYGSYGACTISEITDKVFDGKTAKYYVLTPVYQDNTTFFVPADNESLTSKMRRILSAKEIYELIHNMPDEDTIWLEDENERKELYNRIVSEGDRKKLIQLIKTLYKHQEIKKKNGKKLYQYEDRLFKEAEKLLYEEFAFVLNIKRDQVIPFILNEIKVEEIKKNNNA